MRADSAGRPFAGRTFEASRSPFAGDDGTAPPAFLAAHAAFAAGDAGPEAVVDALRDVRLLVPLLADLGEAGEQDGHTFDKQAELALVTVAGPDGRRVLPAFSSAAAMARWNPAARPVPAPARQVALGAASDGTELVIVDPASPTQFGLRRSALEALARGLPWSPPWLDPRRSCARCRRRPSRRPRSLGVDVGIRRSGLDPRRRRGAGRARRARRPRPGGARRLLQRLQAAWAADPLVRDRVDSLAVKVRAA